MTEDEQDALAQKQVEAFMQHMTERMGMSEQQMQTVATRLQKNGKVYLSIAAVTSTLLTVAGWLAVHAINGIEGKLQRMEDRQIDMLVRLKDVETDVNRLNRVLDPVHGWQDSIDRKHQR